MRRCKCRPRRRCGCRRRGAGCPAFRPTSEGWAKGRRPGSDLGLWRRDGGDSAHRPPPSHPPRAPIPPSSHLVDVAVRIGELAHHNARRGRRPAITAQLRGRGPGVPVGGPGVAPWVAIKLQAVVVGAGAVRGRAALAGERAWLGSAMGAPPLLQPAPPTAPSIPPAWCNGCRRGRVG